MIKKLIARVQKLNPTLKEKEKCFSFAISINPENIDQDISKGSVYSIFDISSNTLFEVDVLQKLVKDVLRDTYYNTPSSSPNHALEKSLIKVKDTIFNIQKKYNETDNTLSLNCILAVLWGDVLYIVKYSDSLAYIMKETTLEPIETIGEGNINFSSLRVKPDQVSILCTKDFGIKYPPNILLTKSISPKDLELNDTCLLLKFLEDSSVSQEDLKYLNTLISPTKIGIDNIIDTISQKFQTFSTFNKTKNKSLFNATPKIKTSNKDIKQLIKNLITFSNYIYLIKSKKLIFGLLTIIFIVISIFGYTLINNSNNSTQSTDTTIVSEITDKQNDDLKVTEPIINDTSKDKELNIERVDISNAIYDMSLIENSFNATDLSIVDDLLYVFDSSSKIYYSSLDNVKFTQVPFEFSNITNYSFSDNKLYYSENSTLVEYDFETNVSSNYTDVEVNNSIGTFNQFVYTFDDDVLLRYNSNNFDTTPTVWGQNDFFNDAKMVQISYSIYVLNNKNEIRKYTTGRIDDFEIKGLDIPLGTINDFVVKVDFDYVYIADPDNSRVVVFDTDGDYIKQYSYVDNQGFNDIKSIAVNDSENMLYVLNGNKIYEVNLE